MEAPLDLLLDSKLSKRESQSKINEISDRIVAKIIMKGTPKEVLHVLTDLLLKPVNSSKRVGRVLLAFGMVLRMRLTLSHRVAHHLAGSLFVLGGYLKNEAKSYLKTDTISPLDYRNPDAGEKLRNLNSDDRRFFTEGGMLRCCEHFVQAIAQLGSYNSQTGYGGISSKNINYYISFCHEGYSDRRHERAGLPPDPFLKDALESTHYCLLSLFDIVQYLFEHLCTFKISNDTSKENPFSCSWCWKMEASKQATY